MKRCPDGHKDVTDWLGSGGTLDGLELLADGQADEGERKSVVTLASEVRSRRVRWAWRGYVPLGYLTIQTGESKIGKSAFFCHVAAQLAHGRLNGEFFGEPARVLIVAAEDSREDMWKPKLQAAGADFDLVAFLNTPDRWNVRDDMSLVAAALDKHPAVLVFVDAVLEHLPDARGSENRTATTFVRSALRPFANLCRERHVAGVISTHPPKARGGSWENAYGGSARSFTRRVPA